MRFQRLKKSDTKLYKLINAEIKRQLETVNLIASENFVSPEILEILGSELTNKYSEGYAGKRYYPGNFYYDEIENLAVSRGLGAFKLNPRNWAVNVQPYSGSPANLEIYSALLKPGETILGMALASGGHLTHGHKVNASGKFYRAVQYGINSQTGLIDYGEIEKLAKKYKPKIVVSGSSAYPRKIDFKKIGDIAKKSGAYHLADISHIAGLVCAGLHPSPFNHSDVVMTTTHKTLKGPRGAVVFINRRSQIAKRNKVDIVSAVNRAVFPGMQGGPHNNVIAAIAFMFLEAQTAGFKKYQNQIVKNAAALARALKESGFDLVTGGTDNHLMLINLRGIGIDGLKAEKKLESAGIIANRNSIFGDTSANDPSGIRFGTPFVTALGMKEKEMVRIAGWTGRILIKKESPASVKKEVKNLMSKIR